MKKQFETRQIKAWFVWCCDSTLNCWVVFVRRVLPLNLRRSNNWSRESRPPPTCLWSADGSLQIPNYTWLYDTSQEEGSDKWTIKLVCRHGIISVCMKGCRSKWFLREICATLCWNFMKEEKLGGTEVIGVLADNWNCRESPARG